MGDKKNWVLSKINSIYRIISLPFPTLLRLARLGALCSLSLSFPRFESKNQHLMGSLLGDWPSFDPHNFSQVRPSDPSSPSVSILPHFYFIINRTHLDINIYFFIEFHSNEELWTLFDLCSFWMIPTCVFWLLKFMRICNCFYWLGWSLETYWFL